MEVRGVVDWLVNLPVSEANFFATQPSEDGTLFVVTVSQNNVPWISIPRFTSFVKKGSFPNLGDQDGQIKLQSVSRLDDEFARRFAARRRVFELLPPAAQANFARALAGTTDQQRSVVLTLDAQLQMQVNALLGL